jgi:preprotein translocase subunit YajC
MLILMGGMFLIMYLFMIRPQMKKMKEARKFQEALSVGDKVITTSGIHGKVVEIGEKDVVISIDQGRMRVEKAAISPSGFVAEQGK